MYNLIEDYLDRLSLPLVHRLPYHERQRIRQELRDHLLERVNEWKAQGVSDDEAVMMALKGFGAPEWVGTLILEKHTPLPRLSWWRALVLLLVVGIGSFALVMANHRFNHDARPLQVVDVMLWTAGDKAVLASSSSGALSALRNGQHYLPIHQRVVPPLSTLRPVENPQLRPLAASIQRGYAYWYREAQERSMERLTRISTPSRVWDQVTRAYVFVPDSICVGALGGCVFRDNTLPPGVVGLQVAFTLLVCAAVTGLLLRQRRWVVAGFAAVVLLSMVWSAMVASNFEDQYSRQRERDRELALVVQSLERTASQSPQIVLSSRPRLSLATLGIREEAERLQRLQQLAQLYRAYNVDYERVWREWNQMGLVGKTWRVFRAFVVPTWWIVPIALLAVAAGGWLGITLGVWAWRVRSYLVYRYV